VTANIEASGIGKDFGQFSALNDISMTIPQGEFLTLLGPSGSGKSTFLMVLAGFEAATRGKILFDGRDVTHHPAEERGFGMVFQGYALFPHMSVEENIAFPLKVQKRSGSQIKSRVADMIELMGLSGHERKRASGLSGGQQQRVALARALAYEPPVLLLDEPFSALDKNLREQMQDEMRRIHKELGTTFVFVTHDQSEALALSQRIAIFQQGELQQLGSPSEVYDDPTNQFVAEFLGDINIFNVDVDEGTAHFCDQKLQVSKGAIFGKEQKLAIRPEYMSLDLQPDANRNSLPCTLVDQVYKGARTRLSLKTTNDTPLIIDFPTPLLPDGLASNAQVWASWDAKDSRFI
jgi:putative spermidine/putrescine transport system ATP-binding protein